MNSFKSQLTNEEQGLLANDLRVLIADLNTKLQNASRAGLKVEIEKLTAWVLGNPAMQTELQIRIYSEIR